MRCEPLFEVRKTNRMRFAAQFVRFTFREPPNLGTIMQHFCRRRPNGNVSRMDQVEVHKALRWKRAEFRFGLQIIQSNGHGDFARDFDGMGIARRGRLDVLMPVVRSDGFVFYLNQEISRGLWRGMRVSVKSKTDVSEEAVRLRDREPRQVAGLGRREMMRRFAGPFRY